MCVTALLSQRIVVVSMGYKWVWERINNITYKRREREREGEIKREHWVEREGGIKMEKKGNKEIRNEIGEW